MEINGCKDVLIDACNFSDYNGTSEALQLDYAGSPEQFPWFAPYDDTLCDNVVIKRNVFTSFLRSKIAIGNHTFKANIRTKNVCIEGNTFTLYKNAINLKDIEGHLALLTIIF